MGDYAEQPKRGGMAPAERLKCPESMVFCSVRCVDTEFLGSYTVPGSSLSRFEGGFV